MLNIVAAAVKNKAWQGTNGIITEGASTTVNNDGVGFKGVFEVQCASKQGYLTSRLPLLAIFIRGLLQAYRKRADNTNLRTLLHSYIDVQVRSTCLSALTCRHCALILM